MSRHSFWISLTLAISIGCLVKAQSFERKIPCEREIFARERAITLQAGKIWIYSSEDLTLDCVDLSGNLLLHLDLQKTTEIPLGDFKPADYAIDKKGPIHVVGVAFDPQTSKPYTYLLNYDSTGRLTGEHRLEPWVAAKRVVVGPDGNLVVLGLDPDGLALERRQGKKAGNNLKIRLVHVYSPEGILLRSLGAIEAPSDSDGWRRLSNELDHVFTVDAAGKTYFQTDRSRLVSLSPDGHLTQFDIPTAEGQVRLILNLIPSRNGVLAVLLEGQNQVPAANARMTGSYAMENPTQAIHLLETDGLRLVKGEPDTRTRIIGQLEDGRWLKAKIAGCQAAFFVEDGL